MLRTLLLLTLLLTGPGTAAEPDLDALRGKVVFVDFWASWCSPCHDSFPWMQAMHQKYAQDGLIIIAINVDQDPREAARFLARYPHPFLIEFDPEGRLAQRFAVQGMPSSYLIDRQGRQRYRHQGFFKRRQAEYEQHLQQLLAESPTKLEH